jgi:hypothetical protein
MPSRVLRGYRFDVMGARCGNELHRKRISDETVREILGLENVVLRVCLHDMLWSWQRKSDVRGFRRNLETSRR